MAEAVLTTQPRDRKLHSKATGVKRHIVILAFVFSNSNNFYCLGLALQVYNLIVKSVACTIYRQRLVWSGCANNETMENICILDMPATQTLRTTSSTQYHETECIYN